MGRACFNPCFNGCCSSTQALELEEYRFLVSILVLMDVVPQRSCVSDMGPPCDVSILVLMDVVPQPPSPRNYDWEAGLFQSLF